MTWASLDRFLAIMTEKLLGNNPDFLSSGPFGTQGPRPRSPR